MLVSYRWLQELCPVDADVAEVPTDSAVYPTGPVGTVTVHNCRMIHGSRPNVSDRMRPLLLHTYAAADAEPLTCPCQSCSSGSLSSLLVRSNSASQA